MADNTSPLLVPIAAEALVVNHLVQNGVTFHRWEMVYTNLLQFQSPVPPAFSNLNLDPPDPGVHLHWALPNALTRGTQVQATATAQVSGGEVTGLTIVNGGYGYNSALPPVVTIVGETGTGALANAIVTNGIVTGFNIVSGGSGYTTDAPPQVTIAPSQAISFPYVPNRWLVVRYSPATSTSQPRQTMAWLLQSDNIDPNASAWDSNSFVNPFPSTPGAIEPTRLGTKATVLASWAGEAGNAQKLFLQALGPGDATFTAYQPGVVNVFSFYDPIFDQNASSQNPNYQQNAQKFPENTTLSYLVIGWYSDPTHDPLYGPITGWDQYGDPTRSPWINEANPTAAWQALIDALDWTVQDAAGQTTLPSQSVYHASVYDVLWQTTAQPMGVTGVSLTNGGTGYTSAPAVSFSGGGGGTGATAIAEVQNGAVVSVLMVSGGTGYTSPPTVSFSGGGGTGATAVSQISPVSDILNSNNNMTVAVGNSSIDALAAIVQQYADNPQDGITEAELLEAFQYNFLKTLDDADGEAQLDLQIRQAWFGNAPGGTLWQVVAAQTGQTPTGQLSADTIPPPPPLTTAQAALLAELNRNQRALDQATQVLTSMQWELYATWWKKNSWATMSAAEQNQLIGYFGSMTPITDLIDQNLDPANSSGLYQQVSAQQQSVQKQMQALPNPTDPLSILNYATKTLGLDPTKLQLKATGMPRFYQPADPVVLISGMQTSDKQGALNGTGTLPCRFTSQAVTGVNVQTGNQTAQVTVSTSGIQQVIAVVSNSNLPAAVTTGINALGIETFFVDPTDAATIVTVGLNSTDSQTIQNLATQMVTQTAQISTIPNPLAASFAFSVWVTQAWSPLYMEWQVTFYPTVQPNPIGPDNGPQDNWPFVGVAFDNPPAQQEQPCWSFNGTDFDWYGGNQTNNSWLPPTSQSYIGRTFLTPQSTYVFIARLKQYLAQNPNAGLQEVEALIDEIGEWNFLSQRLSGLVDQLIMRDLQQSPPPDSSISQQVGEEYKAVPDPTKGNQDMDFGGGTPFFFPVRGGFIQFNQLTVVDGFGQVVDLMSAGGNIGTGVPWAPVRGRGLAPMQTTQLPQPSQLIQLSPRLVQTARLDFRFISATNDQQETGLWPDSSPVCGWVLPNHLDRGLAVYDSGGNAIGELMLLADTEGNTDVAWLPAPDSAAAVSDPTKIPNQHLSQFVVAFTQSTDQGVGFNNFLQAVDETLWTVDPLGSRADQNLSVLIGRPLALLRAQLQFELDGPPVYNQSWPDTLLQQTAAVEKINFPVRLGSLQLYDDGLMGYFLGDNYTSFNSVHQPQNYQPAAGSYLQPIGFNGNYIKLPFNYPSYTTQYITMLLDPRGDAHAFTGILPTKIVSLPAAYFEDALKTMAVTFRTGPVITDAQTIRLPYPTEKNGTWSWIQRNSPADPQQWTDPAGWDVETIVKANQSARLPDTPPRLVEGWLKLTPTDIED